MSSLADANVQSDLDIAPLLLPAQVLRNDAQAIKAAHELAQVARVQAARRDRQRKLPWSEIEQFTRSGLGSIAIPVNTAARRFRLSRWPRCSRSFPRPTRRWDRSRRTSSALSIWYSAALPKRKKTAVPECSGRLAHRQCRP